jgi:hypothetical protein
MDAYSATQAIPTSTQALLHSSTVVATKDPITVLEGGGRAVSGTTYAVPTTVGHLLETLTPTLEGAPTEGMWVGGDVYMNARAAAWDAVLRVTLRTGWVGACDLEGAPWSSADGADVEALRADLALGLRAWAGVHPDICVRVHCIHVQKEHDTAPRVSTLRILHSAESAATFGPLTCIDMVYLADHVAGTGMFASRMHNVGHALVCARAWKAPMQHMPGWKDVTPRVSAPASWWRRVLPIPDRDMLWIARGTPVRVKTDGDVTRVHFLIHEHHDDKNSSTRTRQDVMVHWVDPGPHAGEAETRDAEAAYLRAHDVDMHRPVTLVAWLEAQRVREQSYGYMVMPRPTRGEGHGPPHFAVPPVWTLSTPMADAVLE